MDIANIVIYLFAASFIFMAAALMFAYKRTRHYGLFLIGMTYGVSAVLGILLLHWWPLAAGFAIVWLLKLLGLDPGPDVKPVSEPDAESRQQ